MLTKLYCKCIFSRRRVKLKHHSETETKARITSINAKAKHETKEKLNFKAKRLTKLKQN